MRGFEAQAGFHCLENKSRRSQKKAGRENQGDLNPAAWGGPVGILGTVGPYVRVVLITTGDNPPSAFAQQAPC